MSQADHGDKYEQEHVHEVYEQIASHFSATRYKPWPIVERFLQELPDGSIGLDIGCGNGKYLAVNRNVFIVGSDRSSNLISIASAHHPHTALVADILSLPHAAHAFDFAISIAVVHHLSTPERRIDAVKAILETLRPGGRALVYVWALEQESSRRGWSEEDDQDVMVPWVMRGSGGGIKKVKEKGKGRKKGGEDQVEAGQGEDDGGSGSAAVTEDRTFKRYYHLYRKGELEADLVAAGGTIVEAGYEKDNWWAVAIRSE